MSIKKVLLKTKDEKSNRDELFHYVEGKKIKGPHSGLTVDCSGLRENCTLLIGD